MGPNTIARIDAALSKRKNCSIDHNAPLDVARIYLLEHGSAGSFRKLHYWDGSFWEYRQSHYLSISGDVVRSKVYDFLANKTTADGAAVKPSRRLVDNVLDALRAASILDSPRVPCWLNVDEEPVAPGEIIACRNGLLHVPTRTLVPHDVRFFTVNAVGFDFEAKAGLAKAWLTFLDDVFAGDDETLDGLQEWMGYLITADTSQQKAALMIGPTRSGKGTIARVTRELVGPANCCAPTIATFGQTFGLAGLIARQVALLSDVRLSTRADMAAIAEAILRITGEDTISVPRKFLPDWTGQLGVRFFLVSNELPAFIDASGALAGRFLLYQTRQSFYGKEDPTLTARLLRELPAIFSWALDGLDRLRDRGHFQQPASSREALEQLSLLGSPIKAFLADRARLEPGACVSCDELFAAWCAWCEAQKRDKPGTKQMFGRNLSAAVPGLKITQPRDQAGNRARAYEGIRLLHEYEH